MKASQITLNEWILRRQNKLDEGSLTEKPTILRPLLKLAVDASPIANHVRTTGHNIKFDNCGILVSDKSDFWFTVELRRLCSF